MLEALKGPQEQLKQLLSTRCMKRPVTGSAGLMNPLFSEALAAWKACTHESQLFSGTLFP